MSDHAKGLFADTAIRDVILPICTIDAAGSGKLSYSSLRGTGFLIGDGSRLVTATHVVEDGANCVAMQVIDTHWYSVGLIGPIRHPSEDITVFSTQLTRPQPSWLRLDGRAENASCSYHVWGYPEDVLYDHGATTDDGRALQRPDLVFSTGHIRRRVSHPLPGLKGDGFYELSEIAGGGSSGAPMVSRMGDTWGVTGLYVGERSSTQGGGPPRELGYALRMDAVGDWLRENGVEVR